MLDSHYINPKLVALYDLDSPWSIDRDFYLSLAGTTPQNILDLGCGTGLLCHKYAQMGHDVTGVDPSFAMLEIARQKTHAHKVTWVQSPSQTYVSDARFDLIIMTGHAFQALLDDADILNTLRVMRSHLKDGGRIVFESRNPHIAWKDIWNYDITLETPHGLVHESRRFLAMKKDRMTFELRYQFPDESLVSASELRFLSHEAIEQRLSSTGLYREQLLGGWDASPFDKDASREMIFIVQAR